MPKFAIFTYSTGERSVVALDTIEAMYNTNVSKDNTTIHVRNRDRPYTIPLPLDEVLSIMEKVAPHMFPKVPEQVEPVVKIRKIEL